jgi:hypothetical protein
MLWWGRNLLKKKQVKDSLRQPTKTDPTLATDSVDGLAAVELKKTFICIRVASRIGFSLMISGVLFFFRGVF